MCLQNCINIERVNNFAEIQRKIFTRNKRNLNLNYRVSMTQTKQMSEM